MTEERPKLVPKEVTYPQGITNAGMNFTLVIHNNALLLFRLTELLAELTERKAKLL